MRRFLKFLKKRRRFCCTSLLLVYLDGKYLAAFTSNLVQNLLTVVLFSENKEKWEKIVATKVLRKNIKWRHSVSKDQQMDEDLLRSSKRGFFRHFLVIYHFNVQKD